MKSDQNNLKLLQIANALTISRAFAVFPVMIVLAIGQISVAWFLLIIAGVTDWLDGWLARKAGGGSTLGARLDPLADKLLLTAPIIWLVSESILPFWAVSILIARELLVSSWRAEDPKGGPASSLGKIKTILQFGSILLMIWPNYIGSISLVTNFHSLGLILFWLSFITAIISGIKYFKG